MGDSTFHSGVESGKGTGSGAKVFVNGSQLGVRTQLVTRSSEGLPSQPKIMRAAAGDPCAILQMRLDTTDSCSKGRVKIRVRWHMTNQAGKDRNLVENEAFSI